VQPIYNEQNEIVGRRGVFQDITERKRRQNEIDQKTEKLYELNEDLNDAQELAHVGSWFHDLSSQKSTWSDETFRIWGFDLKKPVPKEAEILGRIHKEDLELFNTATETVFNEGASYDIEYRICLNNNEVKTIRSICKPIFGDDGNIVSLNGINQDITEQKRRQYELDQKNEKLYELNDALNQAQKLSHIGSWQWNMTTDEAEWSDEMYSIYGVTRENFYPSNENVMKTILPEDLHKMEKGLSSLLVDKMFVPFEFRIMRPSGEIRNVYIMALEKNSQENIFGVTKDITERKKIEEENLKIKNSYISLFDNATISIWNEDFTEVFKEINELRKLDIPNIKIYLEENPDVLFSLISKVAVNNVNKATLKLFKAKSNQDFFNNIDNTFGKGADKVFINLIESIWTNKKSFTSEVNYKKLNGEEFVALFSIPIPKTEAEQKTIPISIQNIQNIKDAESAKKASIKDLNAAQELAHVGSWFYDLSSQKSQWSNENFQIWGFDSKKPTPELDILLSRIHKDDLELFNTATATVFNEGASYDIEYRICLDNDEVKTIRSICRPIFGDDGSIVKLNGINQDITEKKIIEEENLRVKNNYRSLFDNATISIWNEDFSQAFKEIDELRKLNIPNIKIYLEENPDVLLSLISKVIVNSVNKATLKLFKAKSNQDFFNNIHNTFGDDVDKVFINLIASIWTNKKSFTSEVNYKKLNGEEFVAIFSVPIPQTEAEQKTIPISIQNIQSIKDAESAKRASIKDLNAAQELAHVGSWLFNVLTEKSEWSDETYRIWGFDLKVDAPDEDEILNRVHVDDRELFINAAKLAYSNKVNYDIEFRICLPNDEEKWIRSICRIILDDNDNVVLLKGTNQDITEKKRASEKIEKAEELYRLLTDHSNDIVCLQEPDSTFKYMSPSIKNVLGYEPSKFIGKQVFSILHKDDIKSLKEAIAQKVFSREIADNVYSFRARHKDGHFVWLEYLTSPVYIENKISYFVTSARDITQRVEANEIIKTSLELLGKSEKSKNEASKIAKIGYWEYDIATDTFTWSDYIYQIYGLELKDEIPSRATIISLYDKESQEKIAQAIQGSTPNNSSFDLELKFTNLKNEEVWERSVVQPVYNEQNEVVGRRGVMQDITESKKAHFELELSKKEIENSLELLEKKDYALTQTSNIANIGFWEYDIVTDSFTWSDYVYYIYGFDLKDEIPSRKEMVAFYDKESQEKLAEATLNLTLDGVPYDIELKFTNLRNEEVWARCVVQPVYNDKNEIIGRRGVLQNITASKNAQFQLEFSKQEIQVSLELLEKSEYSKNEASKIAEIGYWEHDFITDCVVWSDYIHHIFGSNSKEGVPGREEVLSKFDKESQEKITQATLDLASKGIAYDIELSFVNLKNEDVYIRNVAQPIYNEQNEIIGKRGVMQDITSSKKAQIEIELSRHEIETSLNLLETSEFSKNEASKVAKIGYLEYEIATDTFIWSEYLYYIFGFDPKEKVPPREEIMKLFDKESQEKMKQANFGIEQKGIAYDLDFRIINLRNEELWIRIVVQPIYNDQKEIVGRKGITQDITASKKAQIELENSLDKLEKSEFTKNEVSKIAKIGYHEYCSETDSFTWSEYLYDIFGFDKTQLTFSREEVATLFDNESKEKMKQVTLDLNLKGAHYDVELKLTNLRNEEVWVRNVGEPVLNEQNDVIGRRGVTQYITSFKKAQLELELSKQKIETSLDLLAKSEYSKNEASKVAKIGFLEDDIATDTFIWSEYLYYVFGFDPKKKVPSRKVISALFDEESKEKMAHATLELDSKGIPFDLELNLINLRNEEVWVRIVVHPVYNDQNEIVKRRGVLQDITVSKKAQLELELSKQEIETSLYELAKSEYTKNEVSKVAKIGYHEYDIATDVFIWSEYLYDIFGFDKTKRIPPREEVFLLFDKESQKKMKAAISDLDLKGIPFDLELKVNSLNNEEVWVRNIAEPVYNENNELVGRRGITQNITSFKKAQFEIELSKEEIQLSLELLETSEYSKNEASKVAKIGYHEYDIATDTFIWSDYVYRIFGFEIKDGTPPRKEVFKLLDRESKIKMKKATLELDLKGSSYDLELKLINLKKKKVWIRIIAQPVYNERNEIVKRRGILQDITISKEAQFEIELSRQEIQESLELLANKKLSMDEASKVAKLGYHEYDNATDTYIWSDYVYHVFGLDLNEPVPSLKEILLFYDKESQIIIEKSLLELDTMGVSYDAELKLFNPKKEEEIWIRNVVQPVYNDKNKIVGRRGVMQDITERKKIEEEHLRIKDNYRRLFENATISIWNEDLTQVFKEIDRLRKLDIPNIKIYLEQNPDLIISLLQKVKVNTVNKATLDLFKAKDYHQFLGGIEDTFGKGAHEVFENLLVSIWNYEKTFTSEVNFKTLEGEEFVALFSVSIPQTKLEQKSVPASIQSIQNIKDAEIEKRKSINRLKVAEKLAHVGSWVFNSKTEVSVWSEEMFYIWGFDLKEHAPELDKVLSRIHKDDLELFNKAVDNAVAKGTPYDIEFRILPPNQEQKWIRGICKPLLGFNGVVVGLSGSNQDITDQKRANDEIKKAEEMYSLLTNNSNDIICLQELDSTFSYISPSVKSLLGYEQSDFLGKQIFDLVHKDDIQPLADAMEQRLSNGVEDAATFRVRHKQGHFIWLESLSSPVYKNNEISYFVTSSRDVTEWVLARQEINKYQTSLQKMTTEMTLIEEKQKKEIASNIHDHLSQSLVISKMKINELKKQSELEIINEDLKFIESHISEALENSRKITYELSPPVLYQLGIIDALNWLLEDVETNHKIECKVNSNVNSINLSDANSILLYRCIQEVIKNVVKYANASLITLNLDKNKFGINIVLTDNGDGFDTSVLNDYQNHSGSGFGLFAVQERVKNIKGEFAITSKINTGTSVKIFIPLAV
jgi:PAS domain S-box-containing protein